MFGPTRYITWAMQFYGNVPFDLASSGIPVVPWSELGVPTPSIDDNSAYARFIQALATYNDVSPAEVIPALGTSHGLFLAYAALVSAGDEVLVEHPGYEPLTRAAEGLGATVRTFERKADAGFRVDPDLVAAMMGPRTRAIVVTSLHNPTGVRVSDDEIRALAAIAEARGAYVLVDEVYAPFEDLPDDGVFKRSARKIAPNVVTTGSLTKCYGLGMHRIGWVLGPPEIIERASAASIATFGHLPLSHASYGAAATACVGQLAKRTRQLALGKRELAETWTKSLANAQWSAPREGLFGLVTLPGRGDLLPRIEATAKKHGVLVGAGSFFGAPESFRLSWATCDTAKFEQGLSLLKDLVTG